VSKGEIEQLVKMATATKDMWVANFVEPWKGDSNSIPLIEFSESINEATETGGGAKFKR